MSEMVRSRGIIKRLSTKENIREVYESLVAEGKIDGTWTDFKEDGVTPVYVESDGYDIINGCLFDVSGAPEEYAYDEEVADAERLNDTDYRIHIYWYNGGDSPIYEAVEEADKEYEKKKESLDNVFWAIKYNDGGYMHRGGSSAPALYTSKTKAVATIEKNWPGLVDRGYEVVPFGEL